MPFEAPLDCLSLHFLRHFLSFRVWQELFRSPLGLMAHLSQLEWQHELQEEACPLYLILALFELQIELLELLLH